MSSGIIFIMAFVCCSPYNGARALAQQPIPGQQQQDTLFQCGWDVAIAPYDVKKYIQERIQYPEEAKETSIQGRVYISFIVNEDGTLSDFTIKKGQELGHGLPEEALRVVRSLPGKWKPGLDGPGGKPAKCHFTVPVPFLLE